MLVGYARLSRQDLDLSRQTTALHQAGCIKICRDGVEEKTVRPGLELALKLLQKGDTFMVLNLECLGYGVKPLVSFIEKLERRGVHFKSLIDELDSGASEGSGFFQLIKRLGQLERWLFLEEMERGRCAKEGRASF